MGRVFLQGSRSTLYRGLAQFVSLALLRWGDKVATENRGRGSVCRNMGEVLGRFGGKNYMPRKEKRLVGVKTWLYTTQVMGIIINIS